MNEYFTSALRYDHGNMFICHTIELTINGPFLNQNWTPIIQQSPADKTCAYWGSAGECIYCASSGSSHTNYGPSKRALAPGSYTETYSASPYVSGGADISTEIDYKWTADGNPNNINACAGIPYGTARFTLHPGDAGSFTLIIPNLGQTNTLGKGSPSGDGQRAFVNSSSKDLTVHAFYTDSAGKVQGIANTSIQWVVTDPAGKITAQFNTTTDLGGYSKTTVSVGSPVGAYSIVATCPACYAQPTVNFAITAIARPQSRKGADNVIASCLASIYPGPPHLVCPGVGLPLQCGTCVPTTAQRVFIWSPSANVVANTQTPEKATFTSSQEGDFTVQLKYDPNVGLVSRSCSDSTVVKVRNIRVLKVGTSVTSLLISGFGNPGSVGINTFLGDPPVDLDVTLDAAHSDVNAFDLVNLSYDATAFKVEQETHIGATLRYRVTPLRSGSFALMISGCGSSVPMDFVVSPGVPGQ